MIMSGRRRGDHGLVKLGRDLLQRASNAHLAANSAGSRETTPTNDDDRD
jgi:hypothetical protein